MVVVFWLVLRDGNDEHVEEGESSRLFDLFLNERRHR